MNRTWLTDAIAKEAAYDDGYSDGKNRVLDEVEEILDSCAHNDAARLIKELEVLLKKHGRQ